MSDNKSNRTAALMQVFSGIGMGLLVGIIVGLSVSEVVSIILGALAALLAAFLGLQDHQSPKTDEADTTVILNKSILSGLRAGSFGISSALAILLGIFLRTHNVLSEETNLKEQIAVWTEAGYDTTEARQYVIYQNLGILPKSMQATPNTAVELKGVAFAHVFGSYSTQVVTVEKSGTGVRIKKVDAVIDCGQTINPDTIEAQIEGSIIMGLTAAYKGGISIQGGKVANSNFDKYELLRINETPEIEVQIIKNDHAPGGIGEPGFPPTPPALGNAIFKATGVRIRKLPMTEVSIV